MTDGGTTKITVEVSNDWYSAVEATAARHGVSPRDLCAAGRCYVVNNPKKVLGDGP